MDLTKYFSSKKRDHSSNSNDGNPAKIVREDVANVSTSSDVSISNDDVFEGALDSSTCKEILFNCLKDLDKQYKEIRGILQETKESQIKGESQLNTLTESVKFISDKFDAYEEERKENNRIIKELRENADEMSTRIKELEEKVDKQEQYTRRNCLLIHGIKEEENENTDDLVIQTIKEDLHEDITQLDLDRSHRIGKASPGKARPIIVKFTSYNVRSKVFGNKRKLKGKRVSITESLTKLRVNKLNEARDLYDRNSVWTSDGRILVKDEEGKIKVYYD